jgi:integrase
VQAVVALYNHAIDEGEVPLERSPARKLTGRHPGRAGQAPPTPEEFEALVAGCSALGEYAQMMRALLLFATYTLMRPGELFALEWSDIDFPAMRIKKTRRLLHGTLDTPKTGSKLIGLPQPALDAIKSLPRDSDLVFTSKTGAQLSAKTLSLYWREVQRAAGVRFEFYHATKHYGVHWMWTKLGLSPRAIAAQAGWRLETANRMLAVYGYAEVGALEEVDEVFDRALGFPGREVGERLDRWQPRRRKTVSEVGLGALDWRGGSTQRWGS